MSAIPSSSSMALAAHQFPQFHFRQSLITSSNLTQPHYLTLLAGYPLPQPAQIALSLTTPLPPVIQRSQAHHHLVACVTSEPSIKLYNYTEANPSIGQLPSLEHFSELRGHTGKIHDIKFHNVHTSFETEQVGTLDGRCMLSSCSEDTTVKFWDVRQQQPALNFKHPKNKPFHACASAGNLLVAGSGPFFYLWDFRTSKLLTANEECHTEDINQIAFHPLNPTTFFTGAEDGLICEIKPEDPDEDEWLQNVINIENPVSRFGFFGPSADYIWALSCVETLSLWHLEECARISDFAQIRDNLTRAANMPIDYLIDVHYDQQSQHVFLASGTNAGELILNHVNKTEIQPFCLAHVQNKPTPSNTAAASSSSTSTDALTGFALKPLTNESPFALETLKKTAPVPTHIPTPLDAEDEQMNAENSEAHFLKDGLVTVNSADGAMEEDEQMGDSNEPPLVQVIDASAEGHTATIRDVLWFHHGLITAGEDSRICLWTTDPSATTASSTSSSSSLKIKDHTKKSTAAGGVTSPSAHPYARTETTAQPTDR